eukprot:Hpha_TRINITY_DN609_c0_g1::TRINITY_DN609_c0_g1_i1::g.21228::m.21228
MSILDAQPLPSVQHDIDDMQYDAYVTRRERFSLLYSGGFIRWFYAVCLALTVFLVAWTASTGDHRSWWVKVLEALLTLSFAGEVWLRVWIHPRGLRQSRTVGAEAALSAVCVVVWLSSEILGSWLDELDDVLLGVRYAAQSIRILYFARAELLFAHERKAQYVQLEQGELGCSASDVDLFDDAPEVESGIGSPPQRPETDFSLFLRDCTLNDTPLEEDHLPITPQRRPGDAPPPSP